MRKQLKNLEGEYIQITGYFKRYGIKDSETSKWSTAVLINISYNGHIITDHLWFTLRKDWLRTTLVTGTKISVVGKVEKYTRRNGSIDYGLVDTKNLKILEKGTGKIQPAKCWESKSYSYFKFLTNSGPRWYRKKENKVERVYFIYNGSGFEEKLINITVSDNPYINIINGS